MNKNGAKSDKFYSSNNGPKFAITGTDLFTMLVHVNILIFDDILLVARPSQLKRICVKTTTAAV